MDGGRERLEQVLAHHCAPVLCGRKTANLIAVEREWLQYLPELLAGSRVSVMQLCGCRRYCHLLIYDRGRLTAYLERSEHKGFLAAYGYAGKSLEESLAMLAERYEGYQKHEGAFPHEIGLFLEYPLADIEGYIEHRGQDALLSGYWKVYSDVERAGEVFRLYDSLRKMLSALLECGLTLSESAAYVNG